MLRRSGGMEAPTVVVDALASGMEGTLWWFCALAAMDLVQGKGMALGMSLVSQIQSDTSLTSSFLTDP